jgi:hypothetical protein
MERPTRKGKGRMKTEKRSGHKDRIGPLMAWEEQEDEQRLRTRTHNAIKSRVSVSDLEVYADIFTRPL